jgi:hypothetical protein
MKPIEEQIVHVSAIILNWLQQQLSSRYGIWKLSLLAMIWIFCLDTPYLEALSTQTTTWDIVLKQQQEPLVSHYNGPADNHNAKRVYRLAIPVLTGLMQLHSVWAIYLLQWMAGLVFFWLLGQLAFQLTKRFDIPALLMLSFVCIYPGQVFVTDVLAKFDGFALLFISLALISPHWMGVIAGVLLACWTDERGVLSSLGVFLWWRFRTYGLHSGWVKTLFVFEKNSYAALVGVGIYLGMRLYFQKNFGLHTPMTGVSLSTLLSQVNMLFFGLWSGFEGVWLLVIGALWAFLRHKQYLALVLFVLLGLPSLIGAFIVLDITRSLSYLLPWVLIGLYVVKENEGDAFLTKLLWLALGISFLVPTYFAEGAFRIEGSSPIFFKLAELLIRR